jgi:hypothetical protein
VLIIIKTSRRLKPQVYGHYVSISFGQDARTGGHKKANSVRTTVLRATTSDKEFSKPIRVNSQSGSAIAAGTIRRAQLAVGKNGRVHVVWDGMGKGATKANIDGKDVTPLLYTRMNGAGTAFDLLRVRTNDATKRTI